MVIHEQSGSITTSGGTGSATIVMGQGILGKIFVKAASNTTTFDVKLTDIYSNDMIKRCDETGELNENDVKEYTYGNYTMTIENASKDEAFTYLLAFRES